MLDLASPRIADWVGQFDPPDQVTAAQLLGEIMTVSADELTRGLREKVLAIAEQHDGPLGLITERHIRKQPKSGVDRMFKERRSRPRRAYGYGPRPVAQGKRSAPETGSEGIIATLITGLARADPKRFVDHPGPDKIRENKIRAFVIVTDFIGSGKRVEDNLEAAWKVRSFKSWCSSGHLSFAVASYSGTQLGVARLERHRSKPTIALVRGCPTVNDLDYESRDRIIDFCERHAAKRLKNDRTALGYGDAGALIVFDHGIPNNAPLVLHTKWSRFTPLFPRRSTAMVGDARGETAREVEIERSLRRLREKRLAKAPRFTGIPENEQDRMLVLTALKRRPRTALAVSARTGLPVVEVDALVARALTDGYLDERCRLTQSAYDALAFLRTSDAPPRSLPKTNEDYYCPTSLRPPNETFG